MKLKNITAATLAVLTLAGATVGFASKPLAVSKAASKKVTITVSNWPKKTDSAYAVVTKQLSDFEKKNPNIIIKTSEWQYDVNSFLPKAASGQLPTLYVTWFTEGSKIIEAGYSKDITTLAKKHGFSTGINPAILKTCTKNKKLYGLPWGAYSIGLLCNVKLFKEAGLVDSKGVPKFPATWYDLAKTAKTIKQKTGKSGFAIPDEDNCGGWKFMNIAWSYGTVFEKKTGSKWKATFNSTGCASALQYLKNLKYTDKVLPDNSLLSNGDVQNLLGTDQVAMILDTPGAVSDIVTSTKANRNNFAIAQVPAGPKGRATLMGGNYYMFAPNATSDQVDAAMKWLEYTGFSPTISKDALTALEASDKNSAKLGLPVGFHGLKLWVNGTRVNKENAILDKYRNINMNLWNKYDKNADKNVKTEEPVNCQELYKSFDTIIQAVLTNKNTDIKKTLNDAATYFQSGYLNNAQG